MTEGQWERVFRPMAIVEDAQHSRDVEAILLGTAPHIQIGMRRVGGDSGEDIAPQPANHER